MVDTGEYTAGSFLYLLAETRFKLPENPVHTVSAPFLEEKSLKSSN